MIVNFPLSATGFEHVGACFGVGENMLYVAADFGDLEADGGEDLARLFFGVDVAV